MRTINSVVLIGRLSRDPELRYLPNGGTAICNFNLAVDRNLSREKKQEAEAKGYPTADFINIKVWGKMGESVANYMTKGKMVAIQGRIETGSYTAQDGTKRYTTDVVAERVEFLGGNSGQGNNNSNNNNHDEFIGDGFHPVDEDDCPF